MISTKKTVIFESEGEKVTLFDEEFEIKFDTPTSKRMSAFYKGKRVTVSHEDKVNVLIDIVTYYEDNLMPFEQFVEHINEGSKQWMAEDANNRFVAQLPTDAKYWRSKGITTVKQLRHYLDDEFEFSL